jgi:hypothetical protein
MVELESLPPMLKLLYEKFWIAIKSLKRTGQKSMNIIVFKKRGNFMTMKQGKTFNL